MSQCQQIRLSALLDSSSSSDETSDSGGASENEYENTYNGSEALFIDEDLIETDPPSYPSSFSAGISHGNSTQQETIDPAAKWKWNLGAMNPNREHFLGPGCGWNLEVSPEWNEESFWKLMLPQNIIEDIVLKSNKYAELEFQRCRKLSVRQSRFTPITTTDFYRYVAVRILMGIDKKPKQSHYWTKDEFLGSSIVPKIMPYEKYVNIQRYLHFADENPDPNDKIRKIRGLWDRVMNVFQEILIPHEYLSVDESLVKFRGRFGPRQFIPSKRNRFGIKLFSVVDEKTRFILKSIIYAGKDDSASLTQRKQYGYGGSIVLDLSAPYLKQYRTIFCDNFFSSPSLAEKLLAEDTYLCGTLRPNRRNVPPTPKLLKGEAIAMSYVTAGKQIMVEFWRDRRIVRMISTGSNHEMVSITSKSGRNVKKPRSVLDYNSKARGIDLADSAMQCYDMGKKTNKWSMKAFFRLLDITIYNAHAMMKDVRGQKLPYLDFKMALVKQILSSNGGLRKRRSQNLVLNIVSENGVPKRLTERHFLQRFGRNRICKVCGPTTKKRTPNGCLDCNVHLCRECFVKYHTLLNY